MCIPLIEMHIIIQYFFNIVFISYQEISNDLKFRENRIPTFFILVLRKDVKKPIPKYRLKEMEYPVSTYDFIFGVNNVLRWIFSVKGVPCKKGIYFKHTYFPE